MQIWVAIKPCTLVVSRTFLYYLFAMLQRLLIRVVQEAWMSYFIYCLLMFFCCCLASFATVLQKRLQAAGQQSDRWAMKLTYFRCSIYFQCNCIFSSSRVLQNLKSLMNWVITRSIAAAMYLFFRHPYDFFSPFRPSRKKRYELTICHVHTYDSSWQSSKHSLCMCDQPPDAILSY